MTTKSSSVINIIILNPNSVHFTGKKNILSLECVVTTKRCERQQTLVYHFLLRNDADINGEY